MSPLNLRECLMMLKKEGVSKESIYIENHKLSSYGNVPKCMMNEEVLLMFQDIKGTEGIWHIYLRTKERK